MKTSVSVLSYLKDVLSDVIGEIEYSLVEKEKIKDVLNNTNDQEELFYGK